MSIDVSKAFDVREEGVVIVDNDGQSLLYITAGNGSPIGTQAPVPTIYVQDDATIWKKFGPTVNDWQEVEADRNIDGGFANAVFQPSECFDGGDANG